MFPQIVRQDQNQEHRELGEQICVSPHDSKRMLADGDTNADISGDESPDIKRPLKERPHAVEYDEDDACDEAIAGF